MRVVFKLSRMEQAESEWKEEAGAQQQHLNCPWLKKLQAENQQIGKEIDTVLTAMEMIFSIMQLRDLSASGVKEDINKEFSEGKEKVRTLFNNLIETGEPAFVDRFFRALNLPKDFQHLI